MPSPTDENDVPKTTPSAEQEEMTWQQKMETALERLQELMASALDHLTLLGDRSAAMESKAQEMQEKITNLLESNQSPNQTPNPSESAEQESLTPQETAIAETEILPDSGGSNPTERPAESPDGAPVLEPSAEHPSEKPEPQSRPQKVVRML